MRTSLFLLVVVACSPATPAKGKPTPPAPSATASPAVPFETKVCERACAGDTKCGGDKPSCLQRCIPMARVLLDDVIERMAVCVEKATPAKCDPSVKPEPLIGRCVLDAAADKTEQDLANVELFAKAYCERTQACGVVGPFSPSKCLGEAKGVIRSTEAGYLGALRPGKIDDTVRCLVSGACDLRKPSADKDLDRCLGDLMAKAAEEP